MRPFTGPLLSGETLIVTGVAAELYGYNTADGNPSGAIHAEGRGERGDAAGGAPASYGAGLADSRHQGRSGPCGRQHRRPRSPISRPSPMRRPPRIRRPPPPGCSRHGCGRPCAVSTPAVARPLRRGGLAPHLSDRPGVRSARCHGRHLRRARALWTERSERGAGARRAIGARGDRRCRLRAQRHRLVCGARAGSVRHCRRRSGRRAAAARSRRSGAAGAHGRRVRRHGVSSERRWPLAWSGVPSEIGVDRIAGPETYFVARGPLGLRLIYIKPVLDPVSGHRVGVIAAERLVSSSRGIRTAAPEEGVLSLPTLVPVTVHPHDPRASAPGFVVQSPLGQPLLVARVTPQAIQETRARWRGNISAVVLGILALTLIVALPPLLRWREAFPKLNDHLKAIGVILALLPAARLLLWFAPTARWTDQVFRLTTLGPGLRTLLRTPIDFLLTMATIAAVVVLAFDLVERLRRTIRHRLPPPETRRTGPSLRSRSLAQARRSRCCSSATKCCSATRFRRRRSMRCTFRCTRSSRRASRLLSACSSRRRSSSGPASSSWC